MYNVIKAKTYTHKTLGIRDFAGNQIINVTNLSKNQLSTIIEHKTQLYNLSTHVAPITMFNNLQN